MFNHSFELERIFFSLKRIWKFFHLMSTKSILLHGSLSPKYIQLENFNFMNWFQRLKWKVKEHGIEQSEMNLHTKLIIKYTDNWHLIHLIHIIFHWLLNTTQVCALYIQSYAASHGTYRTHSVHLIILSPFILSAVCCVSYNGMRFLCGILFCNSFSCFAWLWIWICIQA